MTASASSTRNSSLKAKAQTKAKAAKAKAKAKAKAGTRKATAAAAAAAKAVKGTRWECVLDIKPSNIKGAGNGLFARVALASKYRLPVPYRGRRLDKNQVHRLRDGSYLFFLKEAASSGGCAGIDARKVFKDNPLRYCNGARTPAQMKGVNVRASQRGKDIYFFTKRRIKAGEELLIDYGPQYWSGLRHQIRTEEIGKEVRSLKRALAALPKSASKRQRDDLEEQLQRCQWDMEQLEEGSDADSD